MIIGNEVGVLGHRERGERRGERGRGQRRGGDRERRPTPTASPPSSAATRRNTVAPDHGAERGPQHEAAEDVARARSASRPSRGTCRIHFTPARTGHNDSPAASCIALATMQPGRDELEVRQAVDGAGALVDESAEPEPIAREEQQRVDERARTRGRATDCR